MRIRNVVIIMGITCGGLASDVAAAVLYESATLGTQGVLMNQLVDGEVRGSSVNESVFVGVRFEIKESWITSRVGGHVVSGKDDQSFFGAIVELVDASDFPDSEDLSTPDVLRVATLKFPSVSTEVFGSLSVELDPGWYALVFGSGLFGAVGDGALVINGVDIGSPLSVGWQPGNGQWHEPSDYFDGERFVIEGYAVPEPAATALAAASLAILAGSRVRRHRLFSE